MASVCLEGGRGCEAYERSRTCGVTVIYSVERRSEIGERRSVTYVCVYEHEDVCGGVYVVRRLTVVMVVIQEP